LKDLSMVLSPNKRHCEERSNLFVAMRLPLTLWRYRNDERET